MTRKDREENPGESFDGGYHLYAKEQHDARVAKNPDRIQYAIEQFQRNNIEFTLKNAQSGHFHCRGSRMTSCFSSGREPAKSWATTMFAVSMR